MTKKRYDFTKGYLDKDTDKRVKQVPYHVENVDLFPFGNTGIAKSVLGTDGKIQGILRSEGDILLKTKQYGDYLYLFIVATTGDSFFIKQVNLKTNEINHLYLFGYNCSVDMIIKDVEIINNEYIAWVDNLNQPSLINIEKAIRIYYNNIIGDHIESIHRNYNIIGNNIVSIQHDNVNMAIIYFSEDINFDNYNLSDVCFNIESGFSYTASSSPAPNQLLFENIDLNTLPEFGGILTAKPAYNIIGNNIVSIQHDNVNMAIIYFSEDINFNDYSLDDICFNTESGFSYTASSSPAPNQLLFENIDLSTLPEFGSILNSRHSIPDPNTAIIYFSEDINFNDYNLSDVCFNTESGFSYTASSSPAPNQLLFEDINFNKLPEVGGTLTNRHFTPDYYDTAESIRLIKKPPFKEPDVNKFNTGYNRNLDNKSFQFMYYYIYDNGFKSALSFYSKSVYCKGNTDYIRIGINTGNSKVKKIGVCFRNIKSDTIYLIKLIDKEKENIGDNLTKYTIDFYNTYSYTILEENYFQKLFDNVPLDAETVTYFKKVLGFANYREGFDLIDNNGDLVNTEGKIDVEAQLLPRQNLYIVDGNLYNLTYDLTQIANYNFKDGVDVVSIVIDVTYDLGQGTESGTIHLYNIHPYGNKHTFNTYYYDDIDPELHNDTIAQEVVDFNNTGYDYNTKILTISFKGQAGVVVTSDYFDYKSNDYTPIPDYVFQFNQEIDYKICYYDDYNRSVGFIDFKKFSVWNEPPLISDTNHFIFTMDTDYLPPQFATKYKLVRSRNKNTLKRLNGFTEKIILENEQNKYIYLKINISDGEKINNGDILQYKHIYKGIIEDKSQYEVDEIKEGSSSGVWIHLNIKNGGEDVTLLSSSYFYSINKDKKNLTELNYEVGESFPIVDGYHVGDIQSQNATSPCIFNIYDGSFIYDQSITSLRSKIEDCNFENTGKPSFFLDNAEQKNRASDLTISEKYLENNNGLNSFDSGQNNYIEYGKEKGAITGVLNRGDDLVVWQERGVLRQGLNENILTSNNGEISVEIGKLLSSFRYYLGDYGLQNKDTIDFFKGQIYFISNKRVCKLGGSGIYELSDTKHLLSKYFYENNVFNNACINPIKSEYMLIGDTNVLSYNIDTDKWTRSVDNTTNNYIHNNKNLYTIFNDNLYVNNSLTSFVYHEKHLSYKVKFYFNENPSIKKVINSITLESDIALDVKITDEDGNEVLLKKENFKNKEGVWIQSMKKISSTITGTSETTLKGLGEIALLEFIPLEPSNATDITFNHNIEGLCNVRDILRDVSNSASGRILTKESFRKLRVEGDLTSLLSAGDFVMATADDPNIEGDDMHSRIFDIEVTSDEPFELFSILFEIDESKV